MAIGRNGAVVRQLATLFNVGVTGGLTDGQLLERFASRGGEAAELAFAALVERHGSLVLRVCRSVLRDEHEALDAFQATFLVLVNKAGSLWVCDSLAPWLHAVAYRVALCARSTAARRRRIERRHAGEAPLTTTEDGGEADELGAVLHDEIERLPDRYRAPIVLCDLEGRSHDEAARHLGWTVGTVKSRQARGRDRLRGRLVRRGLAPSIGFGALFASGAGAAPVSLALTDATAAVALRFAATGAGAVSAHISLLTKEALMRLMLGKVKWAATSLLALSIVAAGALGLVSLVSGGVPGRDREPAVPEPVQAPADAPREGPGRIYLGQDDGLVAIDPKTGEATKTLLRCKIHPRVSPGGRLVAFESWKAIWVRELGKAVEPRELLGLNGAEWAMPPVWSPDGSKLIVGLGGRDREEDEKSWRLTTVRVNADGSGRREELKLLPPGDMVEDWSVDDRLVTTSRRNAKARFGSELYVMRSDGSDQRQITEGGHPFYPRFSPDGRRVLYVDDTTEHREIWVVGVDGEGRRQRLSTGKTFVISACWSPDGKRIAVISFERPGVGDPPEGRLILLEGDGEGRAEFPLGDVQFADMPDWR